MKKSTSILRGLNDVRASYILDSELSDEELAVAYRPTAKEKWQQVTSSGWFAAAVCAIVAFGTLAGIIWAGQRDPGVVNPAGTLEPNETHQYTLQRVNKYLFSYEGWDHESMVQMDIETVDWAEHPEGQVFTLNGVEYPLTYQRSLYYPSQDSLVHEYYLAIEPWETDSSPYVLLTDNGTLFRTGFFYMAQVDMSTVETDEELIQLVEEALADFADFDSYEYVEISPQDYRIIKWYNKLGDYQLPSSISVGVSSEGMISGFYKDIPHEITMTEADIPTDDEIRAWVAEDIKDSILTLHGPVQLGDVSHKEIIEQNGVECLYVCVEVDYIVKDATDKAFNSKHNLLYIIPVEHPDTNTEKS
ncbi:MAG: hypothetical protein IJX72_05365 [Clostridia bacterium]|nr:hypothetical protein [Clostridia bacterium]